MKKRYVKPRIMVEQFTLTQTIAANCGLHKVDPFSDDEGPTMQNKETCGWNDGFGEVYWLAPPVCGDVYSEDAEVDGYCYHNPNGGITVFGSI